MKTFILLCLSSALAALTAFAQDAPAASSAATNAAQAPPPPSPLFVQAGVDRDLVMPGKTYLNGYAGYINPSPPARGRRRGPDPAAPPTPAGPPVTVAWTMESGPGTVTFADPHTAVTTATFSRTGAYILKLSARNDQTNLASTLAVKVQEPPPKDRLDVVYTKNYQLDSPLWNDRAKALIVGWIPHCIDEINDPNLKEGGINNFIEAGKKLRGEPAKFHVGYPFANAWVHQTVEAMSLALMVDPAGDPDMLKAQQKMRDTLDAWIPIILAAQEPDGYLQTRFTLGTAGDNGRPVFHWDPRTRGEHEGYTAGYFIESAINHYTMTGGRDTRLYDAAKKLADCWVANLGPGKKPWFDGHQEMEQALVRFGRFVNDMEGRSRGDAYVTLAKFLLDSRRGGSEYDQSHLPVAQQYEAVGHAVRAAYTYSGMADIAAETHDTDYQSAVLSLWDNIVNKKYYVTGGIGSGETSEGFGPNYSLRNNAYCESCSSCGLVFFQYKM
ncbi:MAG: beta-L-arabinofuranosidase domain-containing protein, partial [Verrucomicrobiota bacterium]